MTGRLALADSGGGETSAAMDNADDVVDLK
jgi:hypothetical protein